MIDRDEFDSAWSELERFKPFESGQLSRQEEIVTHIIIFCTVKICRFTGKFRDAERHPEQILEAKLLPSGLISGAASLQAAVTCELHEMDRAMSLASFDHDEQWVGSQGARRRLWRTLAEPVLMKG